MKLHHKYDNQATAIITRKSQKLTEILVPYFYIAKSDLAKGVLQKIDDSTEKSYWLAKLSAGDKTTSRVLAFDAAGPLENLVRIDVSALGRPSFQLLVPVLMVARCMVRGGRAASWISPERPIQTRRDNSFITRDQD